MTALSPAVPRPVSRSVQQTVSLPVSRPVSRSAPRTAATGPTGMAAPAPVDAATDEARDFDVTEFVLTEYPRVVSAVRMIAGGRDAAVDAVQEALVQLLTDRDRAWPRNVAAWVTVVASNRARDMHRHNAVGRRVVERLRPAAPEDPMDRASRDLDVLAALETLPRRMRQVCVLHYLQDQSVREIAIALGIGSGTVKTQLHRGRIALARRLGP